jgi:glutamate dehydrogenase
MTTTLGDRAARRVALHPIETAAGDSLTAVAEWPGHRPLLADLVPVFEQLGVRVADAVSPPDQDEVFPTRLELLLPAGIAPSATLSALQDALTAAWTGETELDGLSRLTVTGDLSVLDTTLLRAACRYLAHMGSGLSRSYIEETVLDAPEFCRALLRHFSARHDPDSADPAVAEDVARELANRLAATTTLDQDRILLGLRDVLAAVVRTNAFQREADGRPRDRLVVKIASLRLTFLPASQELHGTAC